MIYIYFLGGSLLFISAATIFLSFIIYRMAFYFKERPNRDLYHIHESEYKDKMLDMIRELDALPFEQVEISSHDGLKLSGRYYHVTDGAPIHIEFHGYKSMAKRDFCGGDRIVRSLKHNTLLIDQRAHGKSEGHVISFGINESLDCLAWVNYTISRFGNDTKIFLIGVSMGAATVLMASGLDMPENVVGIMADCPYSSPWEIISKVAGDMHLPRTLSFPFAKLGAKIFGGFDLTKSSATEAVKRSKTPILLVHGAADGFVPCEMSKKIADACASEITFLTFPCADHAFSYLIDEERYTNSAIDFINKCLNK